VLDSLATPRRVERSAALPAVPPNTTPVSAAGIPSAPKRLESFVAKPFTKLHGGTWLHNRSEKDTFQLLIDAYRLRLDDDHIFSGGPHPQKATGETGFRDFLRLTETRGLLPRWWSTQTTNECVNFGKTEGDHDLKKTVDKGTMAGYYGVLDFPMQLRMFAEKVYGSGPGGQDSTSMLLMKMVAENGQGPGIYSTFDIS
jgi:mitochondrial splicing suppressor protein 51